MRGWKIIALLLAASVALLTGCEPKPKPVEFGSDQCEYCRMMITEPEFASQALNQQGRSFKFDSVECMAAFDITHEDPGNIHSKWVPDFHNTENWVESASAYYLVSETLRSPMGLYLSANSSREIAEEMKQEYGGEIMNYEQVKEIVRAEWLTNNSRQQTHHQH